MKGLHLNTWEDGIIINREGEDFSGDYLAVEISGVSLGHFEFEMLIRYPCGWRQESEFRRKISVKIKMWNSLVCR